MDFPYDALVVVVDKTRVQGMKKYVARLTGVAGVLAMVCNMAWADGVTIGGGLSVQANAAPVQSSLSLTNLNYALTSLDAVVGVTPSLTPSLTPVYNGLTQKTTMEPPQYSLYISPDLPGRTGYAGSGGDGSQFDDASSSIAVNGGQAAAAKLGNSQQTFSSLTSSDLSAGQNLSVYSQVKMYSPFIVSARTKLVITGDLLLSTQIDSAAVSALNAVSNGALTLQVDARFAPYVSALTASGLSTNAMSTYVDTYFKNTAQYWSWQASASQTFTATGAGDVLASNDSPAGHFEMQIVNDGDTDVAFQLNSIAYTHATMSVVPEASTLSTMALGLVAFGSLGVRRRRTA